MWVLGRKMNDTAELLPTMVIRTVEGKILILMARLLGATHLFSNTLDWITSNNRRAAFYADRAFVILLLILFSLERISFPIDWRRWQSMKYWHVSQMLSMAAYFNWLTGSFQASLNNHAGDGSYLVNLYNYSITRMLYMFFLNYIFCFVIQYMSKRLQKFKNAV